MKIFIKKIAFAFSLVMLFTLCLGGTGIVEVRASENIEGTLYGFSIDEDAYNVTWNEEEVISAYYNGKCIGMTCIYQGKAVAKQMISGKYAITYLTAVKTCPQNAKYSRKVLWWTDTWTEYGFNKTCELSATLTSGSKLLSSTPSYKASDTTYSVGVGAGVDSSGANGSISGSVNFTDEAINISNYSSTANNKVDIRINLNESSWRWDWKRYKYAQQENFQLYTFTVLSDNKYVNQTIKVNTQYRTMDSNANYWKSRYNHYASCSTNVSI